MIVIIFGVPKVLYYVFVCKGRECVVECSLVGHEAMCLLNLCYIVNNLDL